MCPSAPVPETQLSVWILEINCLCVLLYYDFAIFARFLAQFLFLGRRKRVRILRNQDTGFKEVHSRTRKNLRSQIEFPIFFQFNDPLFPDTGKRRYHGKVWPQSHTSRSSLTTESVRIGDLFQKKSTKIHTVIYSRKQSRQLSHCFCGEITPSPDMSD